MIVMRNVTPYERFILSRAVLYGYDGLDALANAMQMHPSTLLARLEDKSEWRLAECRRLKEVLDLDVVLWVMLTFYHLCPYDKGYKIVANDIFGFLPVAQI